MNIVENEPVIIGQFRKGDAAAVQHIYNAYYRPLYFFAWKRVGDRLEAEDIAVDSILKLLDKKACFDSMPDISSFLYTSVRNACIDVQRAAQRREALYREIAHLATVGEEVINEKTRFGLLEEICRQVENLPPQCREVFKQLFFKCKSSAKVARRLGISSQTVLNQKNKALRLLRTALDKEALLRSVA